jgi:hypothetical protein
MHGDGGEAMDPTEVLRTKDLAREQPRAMDEELSGYAWLPRMIDKARAADAGVLGSYVHPCPVDQRALSLLGVAPTRFREIASSSRTAADVLAALRAEGASAAVDAWFDAVAFEDELINGARAERARNGGCSERGLTRTERV